MKTSFFIFLLISSAAAFGQGYISSEVQKLTLPEHPGHASNHSLSQDQNLRGDESPYTYAQGEMPLREAIQPSRQVPLGDVARQFRKNRSQNRKASVFWAN